MRGVVFSCLIAFSIVSLSPVVATQGLVVLTDVNGRSIQARVLDKTNDVVTVERFDGQVFDIPLSMLSEPDVDYLRSWRPPPVNTVDRPEQAVVIIRTSESTGSGFFVTHRGRTYLYTNLHVIRDMGGLEVTDHSGNRVELGPLEVSASNDLARFSVSSRPALVFADDVELGSDIRAYGNSAAGGVITIENGKVLGVAGHQFETSADIVPGNSGGPIVDNKGKVVGVATYVTAPFNDALAKGTRYSEIRRYALRPQMFNDWTPISQSDLAREVELIRQKREHLGMIIFTYIVVRQGAGSVDIPDSFPSGLRQILTNHNARQRRPDARYRYRSSGDFIVMESVSLAGQKQASLRANLRSLARHIDSDLFDFRWHGATFTSDYLTQQFKLIEDRGAYVKRNAEAY